MAVMGAVHMLPEWAKRLKNALEILRDPRGKFSPGYDNAHEIFSQDLTFERAAKLLNLLEIADSFKGHDPNDFNCPYDPYSEEECSACESRSKLSMAVFSLIKL